MTDSTAVLSETAYLDRAEALLKQLEAQCDRINDTSDADIDNQRVGGMVTLTFPDRSQIVVNLQKPLHEVWLAARGGAHHFKFDMAHHQWLDTKGAGEFWRILTQHASAHAGTAVQFTAPPAPAP